MTTNLFLCDRKRICNSVDIDVNFNTSVVDMEISYKEEQGRRGGEIIFCFCTIFLR